MGKKIKKFIQKMKLNVKEYKISKDRTSHIKVKKQINI